MATHTETRINCDICARRINKLPTHITGHFYNAPDPEKPSMQHRIEVIFKLQSAEYGSKDHHGDFYGMDCELCADCIRKALVNVDVE